MKNYLEFITNLFNSHGVPFSISDSIIELNTNGTNCYKVKIRVEKDFVSVMLDDWEDMSCSCQMNEDQTEFENVDKIKLIKKVIENKIELKVSFRGNKPYRYEAIEINRNESKSLGVSGNSLFNPFKKKIIRTMKFKNA